MLFQEETAQARSGQTRARTGSVNRRMPRNRIPPRHPTSRFMLTPSSPARSHKGTASVRCIGPRLRRPRAPWQAGPCWGTVADRVSPQVLAFSDTWLDSEREGVSAPPLHLLPSANPGGATRATREPVRAPVSGRTDGTPPGSRPLLTQDGRVPPPPRLRLRLGGRGRRRRRRS